MDEMSQIEVVELAISHQNQADPVSPEMLRPHVL